MKYTCEYAIVGGGVAGLSMAISLSQLGKDFLVFEQAPVLAGIGAGFGLAANAMQAFEYLELRQEVEQIGFYTSSYHLLDEKGKILMAPDVDAISSTYRQKNFTIHRADLHLYLLSKIDPTRIVLNKRTTNSSQQDHAVTINFADGTSCTCKYLIVADGVKSQIRQQLIPDSKPRYSGYTCWRATIDNANIQLDVGSETWGRKGRFGMTPLSHNRIYWYACINSKENNPKYRNFTVADLQRHFANYHVPIGQIISETADKDLLWNDIIDIKPLKQFAFGNIVLIGDAAHATTPNMGQGACQAIEDVAVLTDELKKNIPAGKAFVNFQHRRLQRTKYVIDTSRSIGEVSQWSNPLLINIRNRCMRIMPKSWSQSRLKNLLETDFMSI